MNIAYEKLKNYVPIHNAVKTRADGDFLIASNHDNNIFYLNDTARYMWELLESKISIDSMKNIMCAEYDVEPDIIKNDIVDFIRDLQWKKLIKLKAGANKDEEI